MAQPIPPLLCNTPPPIDFDDGNDDDFGDFEGARTDYEGSLSASPRHEVKNVEESFELPPLPNDVEYSLYTPINPPSVFETVASTSADIKNPPDSRSSESGKVVLNSVEEQNEESLKGKCGSDGDLESELNAIKLTETQIIITSDEINRSELKTERLEKLSREDSPQSLDLSTANLSDDEDDSIGEFQVAIEAKYDDNTSLPSLKFDSIIVSKSTTPIFDEKANESKEQVDTLQNKDSTLSALPSLTSSQTNLENKLEDTNVIETINDKIQVSQDKPEELFTEFQQSNTNEEAGESITTTTAAASIKNEEIIFNESSDHTVVDDFQFCKFNDFTLDNDVQAEDKEEICNAENITTENLTSTEDNVVDNFGSFTFEADFSQFESVDDKKIVLGSEPEKLLQSDAPTILPESFENDLIAGDDDDFEEFQDFTTTKVQSAPDDDFGEFSDFDTINPDSSRRDSFKLRNVDGKVKPILDLMFPEEPESSEAFYDSKANSQQNSQNSSSQLTTNLQEIDTAKALEYQWANSNIKQSLIKALGIDSRNILYGEKWNSSVPRFAANLVFNPLEPLRPVKIGGHSSTSSANQEMRLAENSVPPKGNVPEVEFDWNSSGLVNPLDASHAHTLLLDLDQLVVVANLDKIKLDSSSPCSSATLETLDYINATTSALKSSAKTNVPSNTRVPNPEWLGKHKNLMDNNLNGMRPNDSNNILVSGANYFDGNVLFGDGPICINRKICSSANIANTVNMIVANATAYTTNSHHGFDNDLRNDLFDRCLEFSVKEIVCEGKAQAIHPSQPGSINESIEQQTAEKAINTQSNSSNAAPNLPNINNDLTNESFAMQNFTNGEEHITHQINKPGSEETHQSATPTAFVFPLKETHIYTPSKLDSVPRHIKTEDKDPIDFDYKTAAAGIIIDEKVVKKEYRDVEYNPTNWNLGPLEEKYITNSNGQNMCTLNNFENPSDILSSSFSSIVEKNDDLKNIKQADLSENFSSFQYNITRSDSNLKSKETNQKSHETNGGNFEPIMQITDKNDSGLDDDFSDFQSVPPPVINPIKVNNQMLKTTTEDKAKSRTATPTLSDEMILSPSVLLPQAIKLESGPKIDWPEPGINPEELARIEELFPQSKNNSKRNAMPENQGHITGISTNDDDDWSDFVSVPATSQSNMVQMQAPLGSKSTPKIMSTQSNDDEWSDFVSSAPVQWNNPSMLPQYNAWNQPIAKNNLSPHVSSQANFQFQHKNNVPTNFYRGNNVNNNISQYLLHSNSVIADHRPNHFLPQQQQEQIFHNSAQYQNQLQQDQTAIKSQLNQTPSISLIPDLGFVAPRNLINIPRSAISKK